MRSARAGNSVVLVVLVALAVLVVPVVTFGLVVLMLMPDWPMPEVPDWLVLVCPDWAMPDGLLDVLLVVPLPVLPDMPLVVPDVVVLGDMPDEPPDMPLVAEPGAVPIELLLVVPEPIDASVDLASCRAQPMPPNTITLAAAAATHRIVCLLMFRTPACESCL